MTPLAETKEEFASRFARYSRNLGQFNRAIDTVLNGSVKMQVFSPSGRVIYTVVGRSGEEFIDPFKPFCSCKNFFFGVLGGRDQTCYHLLSYEIAKESGMFDRICLHDEEFESFTKFLAHDLMDKERRGT